MNERGRTTLDLERVLGVIDGTAEGRCMVAPSPELSDRIRSEVERVREATGTVPLRLPKRPGLNDGLIIPGSYFPLGTSIDRVRSAASERAPLHGTVRIVVVLVDFDDRTMVQPASHFEDLFFSEGVLPNGSVREYYTEVTNGLVELTGEVVGPYRLPRTLEDYANGESGTGSATPNARTMANDAAAAADADVNFAPYDNDGNGYVDAFIVVHAGGGAEQTGSVDDIWSHKWVLPSERSTDGTKIYAYLTVPEDARIGVCAHELGHLLFGFPDLYDTDNTSEGIGNWCLMAGGSWGGGGNIPAHPSAWCKAQQAWVTVQNVTANQSLSIADVKDAQTVYRLWKDGAGGQEYFLVENRQQDRFDASLPGGGLLIWHIDDAIGNNTNETHYRVALEQADGALHMENNVNRGDAGDCFPGSANNRAFTNTSTPNSKSYGSLPTCVAVTAISDPGPVMTAQVQVRCGKSTVKDLKDRKEGSKEVKEFKERGKDVKEPLKERGKDVKEKEIKEKERKEVVEKGLLGDKRPEKPEIDKSVALDKNPVGEKRLGEGKLNDGFDFDRRVGGAGEAGRLEALEYRLAALEAALSAGAPALPGDAEPFIGSGLRPDLRESALLDEPGGQNPAGPIDKRLYDSPHWGM